MLPLQILYITSGFIALSAGGFQLSKLLKKKNSDEFNLGTWLMWTGTQGVSAAYAISLGDILLVFTSVAWVTFYLMMSVLIIRFSSSHYTLFKSVRPYNKAHDAPMPLPIEIAPDSAAQLELATESAK
ncbi:MAG: hypothetical protein ACREGE_03235 [Candidatus Microsaccharimonas sp.]